MFCIVVVLVGAVGIENNTRWNFKNLEGMMGNAETLTRNKKELKEILIGPSFLRVGENSFDVGLPVPPYVACRLRAQILRRGWQAEIPKNCEQGSQ